MKYFTLKENIKVRNIVVCLIVSIITLNNNSYTMYNNDDNLCENIFKEIKSQWIA